MAGIARSVKLEQSGCSFLLRCPLAKEGVCDKKTPPLLQPANEHDIACHREVGELSSGMHHS